MSRFEQARTAARTFAAAEIAPHINRWEQERHFPRDVICKAGEAGLLGLLVPEDAGGAGLNLGEFCMVMEEIAAVDMGFAFALVPHNNFALSMSKDGSKADRARYLDGMINGDILGAFLLTEPQAGTHAAAITTHAKTVGGGWVLNGEKAWVTGAAGADLLRVYAQTDPAAGTRGIAAFLVPADQPGVERTAPYAMMGCHVSGAGGFRFHDVRLDAESLFTPPGAALSGAMGAIGLARVVVASLCLAILRSGLDTAVEYLRRREAFGAPLARQQGLRWMMADVATDLEAATALTRNAATAVDAGDADATTRAAHAKKFAARAATTGLDACMQVMGANGFRHDHPVARHYSAAKMAHYIDGTTEVQNLVIARALFESA